MVTRVALRALRQLDKTADVEGAVSSALTKIGSLSAREALIQMVGYMKRAGHKLVTAPAAAAYEAQFRDDVLASSAGALAAESDVLRILLAAAEYGLDVPEFLAATVTSELARAILLGAVSETRSRSMGNRAVIRHRRLSWEQLLELFGTPEALSNAIDSSRGLAEQNTHYGKI